MMPWQCVPDWKFLDDASLWLCFLDRCFLTQDSMQSVGNHSSYVAETWVRGRNASSKNFQMRPHLLGSKWHCTFKMMALAFRSTSYLIYVENERVKDLLKNQRSMEYVRADPDFEVKMRPHWAQDLGPNMFQKWRKSPSSHRINVLNDPALMATWVLLCF